MEIIKIILNVVAIIYGIGFMVFALYSRKPIKLISLNLFSGIAVLILAAVFGKYLGFSVYINAYTLSLSGIMGIPGVILLMLISMFL